MNIENQQPQYSPHKLIDRRIVEYPSLVETVQLSAARRLDLSGALAAKTFEQLLLYKEAEKSEEIITAVGARFDEDLVNFVIGSIIGKRDHEMIILAEESEGIQGHLHWEAPLLERVTLLRERGLLKGVEVKVERYSDNYETVADLVTQNHENPTPSVY